MADQKSNSKVWSEFYFELLFALGTKMKKENVEIAAKIGKKTTYVDQMTAFGKDNKLEENV